MSYDSPRNARRTAAAARQREAVPAAVRAGRCMPSTTAAWRAARPSAGDQVDRRDPRPASAIRPNSSCRWISAPPACGFSRSFQLTSRILTSAPVSRATASRTPLMNPGARAPANQCASFTASSITTREGVDASSSSGEREPQDVALRRRPPARAANARAASVMRRSKSGRPAIALAPPGRRHDRAARGRGRRSPATRATTAPMRGPAGQLPRVQQLEARARALVSGRCTGSARPAPRRSASAACTASAALCDPRASACACSASPSSARRIPPAMRCASATLRQPSRRFTGDVLEMRRLAADHAAERHDRVIAARSAAAASATTGSSNAPGHPDDVDPGVRRPPARAGTSRAPSEQSGGDVLRESG